MAEITLLERRRVEAEILKEVFSALTEELGKGKAEKILLETAKRAARRAGEAEAAKENGETGPRSLARVQELWKRGGALDARVLRLDDDHFHYEVVRCGYHEMYKELGMEDLGYILSCSRDSAFVEGYAPELILERESTIMRGGEAAFSSTAGRGNEGAPRRIRGKTPG
ncbi:MAG: L-2-amino-thiazoline-4-carboxylic acid hydrolase [Deltaproteobacteria bacterium]|jgi:hypothetical protein|nr:L-2-amino-thiazoline-4-carboxylic acid hydrolase [Deltaproteobacteria bacterium]